MAAAAPKTPKTARRVMCISPTRGPVEMRKELTFAPRKKQGVSLTKFLHEDMNKMSRDFSMSGNRMGRYVFDKVMRIVKLYAVDIEDDFTSQEPCLIFPAKDWWLFYNNVWRDLNDCGDDPLYIAEWDSIIPGKRFRVVGDHSKKLPDDCVYIFYCNDKTKINERMWPIPESEHYMHYDMRFLFQPSLISTHILQTLKYLKNGVLTTFNSIMSQDPSSTCCYSNTSETLPAMPDDNAVPMETLPQTNDNGWLDKFCMELGYHNLTFLTTPYGSAGAIAGAAACAGIDDTDGSIHSDGFKIIKATVVVILEHLINKKLKELCMGCEVDHPSQLRHSCLFEPNAYFFDAYFEELSRNLIKPELKHMIARALNRFGLRVNPQRIQGSVDAILCELRDEVYIVEKLRQVREKLVDVNSEQIVYDAVDSWKGGPQTA
ncbi:hypothetical protein M9458_043361 [Cirrhinus mrigala]|uniref:Uncharacterized protein n=1 Tax=Cirrhinus mrigala TaxID=683832 RepID=A0ABD0NFD8_CIRMR